jgi:hypothetical protein
MIKFKAKALRMSVGGLIPQTHSRSKFRKGSSPVPKRMQRSGTADNVAPRPRARSVQIRVPCRREPAASCNPTYRETDSESTAQPYSHERPPEAEAWRVAMRKIPKTWNAPLAHTHRNGSVVTGSHLGCGLITPFVGRHGFASPPAAQHVASASKPPFGSLFIEVEWHRREHEVDLDPGRAY